MEPTFAVIPARSKQQALDWSLVLVSQGIESTIERVEEEQGWRLVVEREDCQRALRALRQYKLENRAPLWRGTVVWKGIVFDGRNLAWLLLLGLIFLASEGRNPALIDAGVMDSHAVRSGQWWRLLTAITLHRDVSHLVSNLTTGFVLLGLAMGSFGSGVGLLAAYLAGVAGNLARFFLYTGNHASLGASGMIFGALGLLSGQMLGLLRSDVAPRQIAIRSMISGFLLLVLFGLNPDTDVFAHVGGFAAGVLFGGLLGFWPRLAGNAVANRVAGAICFGLVALTWFLAVWGGGRW
jgi:membrane associated rhomboid family serine protease